MSLEEKAVQGNIAGYQELEKMAKYLFKERRITAPTVASMGKAAIFKFYNEANNVLINEK